MSKKGCLGCSFPMVIGISLILLALFIVGFLAGPIGQSLVGDIGLPDWMVVSEPHVELAAQPVFSLLGFQVTNTMIASWITVVVLVLLALFYSTKRQLVPGRFQAALEFAFGWIYNLCETIAGEKNARRFFPLVATIFLYVGLNAWLALIPGYSSIIAHTGAGEIELIRGANTDINLPLALALVAFLTAEILGLARFRLGYLKKFINVSELGKGFKLLFTGKLKDGLLGIFTGVITLFTGLLEALSEIIRVVSLTFRLFGNMTAGEILLLITIYIIPWVFALPFYGLELLIGFIQALIFSSLTLIYIFLAITPHAEEARDSA